MGISFPEPRRSRSLAVIGTLLLFALQQLAAQPNWPPQQYTSENGLPQNSVLSLAMDGNGYLWFTTEGGLVRFDGTAFHLPVLPRVTGSSQERMRQVISTFDGALLVDNASGDLFEVRDMKVQRSWRPDKEHDLTPRISGGVCSADLLRRMFSKASPLPGRSEWGPGPLRMIALTAHDWYIHGRTGLMQYRDTVLLRTIPLPKGLGDVFLLNGSVYGLDLQQRFFRVDLQRGRVEGATLEGLDVSAIEPKAKGWLLNQRQGEPWAYLRDGSEVYLIRPGKDPGTLRAEHLPVSLPEGCAVSDLLWSDRHHLFVAGTDTKGLFIYRERHMRTRLCATAGSAYNNAYYAVAAYDSMKVLALSVDHRTLFSKEGCEPYTALPEPVNFQVLNVLSDGRLVLARLNQVVFLDTRTGATSYQEMERGQQMMSFLERGAELWVGHGQGLQVIRDGKVTPVFTSNTITVLRNVGDEVWCGTCHNVLRYQPTTGKVDTLKIPGDGCLRSMEVYEGRVFIGTYGGGAYVYDHGRLQRLPMDRQGFLTHVHTFMPDARGRMWISSNRGLFSVSLGDIDAYMADTTNHVYYAYYGRNEGILNPEFNGGCDPAYVRLADGRALFPTLDGLVEFDPDQVPDPVPQGRVLVEGVRIDGVSVDPRAELVLEPGQQEISVLFSLAYWGAQANMQLEYTLSSIQDHWQPIAASERELRFSRLPPGIYVLTIRKLGARAEEEPTRLRFQVLAPFYRQRWFLVMLAMLVVLLFFGAIRLNEMRLRNRNLELETAVKERTREMEQANERLRSSMEVKERLVSIISHDIVTPLRFIARVARSTNRTPEVNVELSDNLRDIALSSDKLYANARNMLSWIKHQEGHIELRPLHVALNPLVEEALDMVRELAASQGDVLINDVPLDDVLRTDRDLLLIILQNIISNAVNYTRNGEVRVLGGQKDDHYELCISDSGPGITPKAEAHINDILAGQRGRRGMDHGDPEMQGLGYVIVGELATLLGGAVEVGNGPNGGAKVTIQLPLQAVEGDPGT
ncbi:MAG: hypothetical protein IPN38_13185 [Flavobacteriales bacterium]|nr:hypothetical protein [Flavobacteriales bacterium]